MTAGLSGAVAAVCMSLAMQPGGPPRPVSAGPTGATGASGLLAAPVDVDPRTALLEIQRAYRAGPTAERMTVSVRQGTRPVSRGELVVRIDPGRATDNAPAPARAAVEAGPLRMTAGEGAVRVIMPANPDTVFERRHGGPLSVMALSSALPPTPLPQLALATAPDERDLDRLVPWVRVERWTSARLHTVSEPAVYRLEGEGPEGTLRLEADGRTGRLRSLVAQVAQGEVVIAIEVAALPDAALPAGPEEDRIVVSALTDLPRRAGELVVGRVLPEPVIVREDGTGVSIGEIAGERGGLIGLLPERAESAEGVRKVIEAAHGLLNADPGPAGLKVLFTRGATAAPADAEGWARLGHAGGGAARTLLIDSAAGRLARGESGAVLIVDRERRVRGWVAVKADSDAKALAGEMDKMMREGN